jgi:hypothetical protein
VILMRPPGAASAGRLAKPPARRERHVLRVSRLDLVVVRFIGLLPGPVGPACKVYRSKFTVLADRFSSFTDSVTSLSITSIMFRGLERYLLTGFTYLISVHRYWAMPARPRPDTSRRVNAIRCCKGMSRRNACIIARAAASTSRPPRLQAMCRCTRSSGKRKGTPCSEELYGSPRQPP